jgi:hypothetical protein
MWISLVHYRRLEKATNILLLIKEDLAEAAGEI